MTTIKPLAQDHVVVFESPNPKTVFCYSPGICCLPSGRLIATLDLGGPGVEGLSSKCWKNPISGTSHLGKIFYSDDKGISWTHAHDFPFVHARPFHLDKSVYVLGHSGDLRITRSKDDGKTWSPAVKLTQNQRWHQAPCNVHYAHGCIYLVMEKRVCDKAEMWGVSDLAPILMRAKVGEDLTSPSSWTFADTLSFHDVIGHKSGQPDIDYFGVPFFDSPYPAGSFPAPQRECAAIGWLEFNVIQITDPDNYWYDPTGRTLHLLGRAHTGGTGYACLLKILETGKRPGTGPMITTVETVPSGRKQFYLPLPGGQMKFHILFDEVANLFWLLSTQATDSMTRAEKLSLKRYNLPNNERRRLTLHFSKNCVDWCFAAMVAIGPDDNASRNYASMAIDGNDLRILSRSGDKQAASAHNGNLITFHTVKDFRKLVYL